MNSKTSIQQRQHTVQGKILTLMLMLLCLPAALWAADADTDTITISSKSDWNTFTEVYNDSSVYVKLNCNLTLADNDKVMKSFKGTFDGQGHTLTVRFTKNGGNQKAPFHTAEGTICNLEITGSVCIQPGKESDPYIEQSPLVMRVSHQLSIVNCINDASLLIQDYTNSRIIMTTPEFNNQAFAGGYISQIYGGGTATFSNCRYTGVIKGGNYHYKRSRSTDSSWLRSYDYIYLDQCSGFVGCVYRGGNLNVEDCYSSPLWTPSDKQTSWGVYQASSWDQRGYYTGWHTNKSGISITNSYSHRRSSGTWRNGQFDKVNLKAQSSTEIDDNAVTSGELAVKLSDTPRGYTWVQALGYDPMPTPQMFAPYRQRVYHLNDTTIPATNNKWSTIIAPTDFTLPEGVTAYVVSGLHDWRGTKSIVLNQFTGKTNRHTPLILNGENGIGAINVKGGYYNDPDLSSSTLKGNYRSSTATQNNWSKQNATDGKFVKMAEGDDIPALTCYLDAGTAEAQAEYAFYTDTTDVVVINSKEEWNEIDSLFHNKRFYLLLNTDLELTDSDYVVENFEGVFDGRGHTITYNLTGTDSKYYWHGLFDTLNGNVVIRNLNITGSISYPKKAGNFPCPLAWSYSQKNDTDSLVVENVHVSTDITLPDGFGLTSSGFIGTIYADAIATFRDCSFTGRLLGNSDVHCFGGFIGYEPYLDRSATPKVSFINCLSDFSGSAQSTDVHNKADYFVGTNNSSTASGNTITNSYARFLGKIYEDDGFVYNYYSNRCNVPTVTPDQLHNGEVTFKLNAGRAGSDIHWAQTIGQDTIPQLKAFAALSKEVLYTAESKRAATTDKWATLFYPTDVTLPADANIDVYNDFACMADTIYIYGAATNTVAANRPALLYAPNGVPELTLPACYYNIADFDTDNDVLYGSYSEVGGGNCTLTITDNEPTFTRSDATIPAWTAYLPGNAYDVNYILDDGVIIASQEEWSTFKTKYNGRKVNVRLFTPLTIASADDAMQKYSGTFNAYGTAISTTGGNLFAEAEGTILNIQQAGSHPLVGLTSGNLTFKNCKTSGMPLLASTGHTVTFDHCFSNMSAQTSSSTDAFVALINGGSATATSSYVWGTNCTNKANATVATDEQTKGGELTYLLNDGRTDDDCLWTQTIGTDIDPQLWSYDSETVYQASGTLATNASGYGTCYYLKDIELPQGIKAYTASEVKDTLETSGVLVLTELTGTIPAYTPVVLYNESGEAEVALPTAYYNLTPLVDKMVGLTGPLYALHCNYEAGEIADTDWYLLKDDTFEPADSSSSYQAWTCFVYPEDSTKTYDKVYIETPTATAISALISTADGNAKTYDLQGRQVRTLQKGQVYIKNGVKFVVK